MEVVTRRSRSSRYYKVACGMHVRAACMVLLQGPYKVRGDACMLAGAQAQT